MRLVITGIAGAAMLVSFTLLGRAQVHSTAGSPQAAPPVTTEPADEPVAPAGEVPAVRSAAAFPVSPELLVTAASAVNGATKFDITFSDGTTAPATLVRCDDKSRLALMRLKGQRLHCLSLANDFTGGDLECAAFTSAGLFNPAAELIKGSASLTAGKLTVRLTRLPHSPGGPLVANGKVVGVELADRDADPDRTPCATLHQLRDFLKSDASASGDAASAVDATVLLTATRAD